MTKGTQIPKVQTGEIIDADVENQARLSAGNEEGSRPYAAGGAAATTGEEDQGSALYSWGNLYVNKDKSLISVNPATATIIDQIPWSQLIAGNKVIKVAGETIAAGDAIRIDPTDENEVLLCNASTFEGANGFIGFADNAAVATQDVTISLDKKNLGATAFNVGDILFLSNTPGAYYANNEITDNGIAGGVRNSNYFNAVGYVYETDASNTWVALGVIDTFVRRGDTFDRVNLTGGAPGTFTADWVNQRANYNYAGGSQDNSGQVAYKMYDSALNGIQYKILKVTSESFIFDETTTPDGLDWGLQVNVEGVVVATNTTSGAPAANITSYQTITSFSDAIWSPTAEHLIAFWTITNWSGNLSPAAWLKWFWVYTLNIKKLALVVSGFLP